MVHLAWLLTLANPVAPIFTQDVQTTIRRQNVIDVKKYANGPKMEKTYNRNVSEQEKLKE